MRRPQSRKSIRHRRPRPRPLACGGEAVGGVPPGPVGLIWGSSFLWIKVADRGFAPVEVTFARLALGAAALFPVVAARREALPRSAAVWAQIGLGFLARRGMSPIALSACQLLVAAALLAIVLPVSGSGVPQVSPAGLASLASLVILGVLGTGVAYVLNYQLITSEGATVAATVTYLLPVVAIILGVLVLGETVTVTVLAGIALVLAGVALTRRRDAPAAGDENGPRRHVEEVTGHQPAEGHMRARGVGEERDGSG
jgi:drug/metabolite transporter (DMT)-like permease